MEEQMLHKSSGTLHPTGYQAGYDSAKASACLGCCLLGWGVGIVMEPSKLAGTTAFSSNETTVFDTEIELPRPERILVMTDEIHPTDGEGLEALWSGLQLEEDAEFDE